MKLDLADEAVAAVQEAAFFPERWPAALSAIAQASGASIALAQMIGKSGYASVVSDITNPELLPTYYAEGWYERNAHLPRGMSLTKRGFRGSTTEQHMFSGDELARDAYTQEFSPRFGNDRTAGLVLTRHGGSDFVLTIERSSRIGTYQQDELTFMNALVARLEAACGLALRFKLSMAVSSAEQVAAQIGAVALLGESGFSLFHSRQFEGLLGDVVVLHGGRVSAVDRNSDVSLQEALARSARWNPAKPLDIRPVVLARPGSRPVLARCHPVAGAARDLLGLAKTMLILDDLDVSVPPPQAEVVAHALGLTAAEARLACHIGNARTLREAANEERISYESARTRLKIIFDKTGTSSQVALAVLVGRF